MTSAVRSLHALRAHPLLVATFAFGLVVLAPRMAQAGCSIECASIENRGITITPPLACIVPSGVPDDNNCVCASAQRYVNECEGAVEVAQETIPSGCTSGCGPKTIARGESFELEVRVPTTSRESGDRYVERASERYVITRVGDPAGTKHIAEISAEAIIDPEAAACSASPRPLRGSHGAFMASALGVAFLGLVRRGRRRPA